MGEGHQHLWEDTIDIMGWRVDEDGLGVVFDRSIPTFAEEHFAEAANGALKAMGIALDDIDRFVCHPGGVKVVEALERTLNLNHGSLDAERAVLRDYGNMSAPTALFVLKHVLEQGASGSMVMTALGPGFTASFLPLTLRPKEV